jgi:hypothetical protein
VVVKAPRSHFGKGEGVSLAGGQAMLGVKPGIPSGRGVRIGGGPMCSRRIIQEGDCRPGWDSQCGRLETGIGDANRCPTGRGRRGSGCRWALRRCLLHKRTATSISCRCHTFQWCGSGHRLRRTAAIHKPNTNYQHDYHDANNNSRCFIHMRLVYRASLVTQVNLVL